MLVLNPGTSASSAYFAPLARTLVDRFNGWQVWSVERRENLLEDQSVLQQAKDGTVTPQRLFDYYLGWLTDSSITNHFRLIPDSEVGFARQWGMRVEVGDLRRVVQAARQQGRKVVLGGHSLGGSITTAYPPGTLRHAQQYVVAAVLRSACIAPRRSRRSRSSSPHRTPVVAATTTYLLS